MLPYDASQKLLFCHPQMVAGLLELGVDEPWVTEADLSQLELVPASYVSRDLKKRRGDMVWRLRLGHGWVYLLLEFQSRVNHWMSVRFSTYSGLFREKLIRVQKLSRNKPLPPVFPLLLFNGKGRWTASDDARKLAGNAPEELIEYLDRGKYCVVDMHRFRSQNLIGCKNAFACLVRLEKSRNLEEVDGVVQDLIAWFPGEEHQDLRQDMAAWLLYVVVPGRFPGLPVPESVEDLMGFQSMLRERVKKWPQQWMEEGAKKGRQEGRRQGRREAQRETFLALLAQKFGELPEERCSEVSAASADTLLRWTKRIMAAERLEQVFR